MRTGSIRVAEISLPAIRHNVRHLRHLSGAQVIAVIKANGYGHGAAYVARAAIEGGAALLGVADVEEALALRAAGIADPVLCWLHGARADFAAAVREDIQVAVNHLAQLDALAEAAEAEGQVAVTQLKIDTGLSRNGAARHEWPEFFARAAELERAGLVQVRGIFSHLANAGADADRAQAARFDEAVAALRDAGCEPEMIHLASSAATLSSPHLHYNTVRVGMAIYGLSPFADRTSADLGLIPAMTLRSEIVALRSVPAGTGVSYGYNHVAQSDTTLALVPMGYADGLPRALNGAGATVAIAGQHCPIVGRIGMDQCIVDLGRLGKRVRIGEPVVLFGDPSAGFPPVEVWAEVMQTINYEIVVGIGPRVNRVIVDDPDAEVRNHTRMTVDVATPDEMHDLGVRIGKRLTAGDVVILTGRLGAGKTTLSRGIGEGMQVRGPITSPTFVIARTHPSLIDGPPLVHVDAYRLGDATELDDLDLDYEGSVVLAEWGSGLVETGNSYLEITIERPTGDVGSDSLSDTPDETAQSDDAPIEPRTVTLTGHGDRWAHDGVLNDTH